MEEKDILEFKFDTFGVISLVLTGISVLISFQFSPSFMILSVSIFLISIAAYIYFLFKNIINKHAQEIKKINEKINIYKDIAELKAKVELLMSKSKMEKRGRTDIAEILIRLIQIAAIILAGYIILKALGFIK